MMEHVKKFKSIIIYEMTKSTLQYYIQLREIIKRLVFKFSYKIEIKIEREKEKHTLLVITRTIVKQFLRVISLSYLLIFFFFF